MKKYNKYLYFIPSIAWMAMIFWFSSQDGISSGASSNKVLSKAIYLMEHYVIKIFRYLRNHTYLIKYSVLLIIFIIACIGLYFIYKSNSKLAKIAAIILLGFIIYIMWGYRHNTHELFIIPSNITAFIYRIIHYVTNYLRSATIGTLELLIRKAAHISLYFGLYFVLFIGYLLAFKKVNYTIPFTVSVLYAMSDEFHQLFVDGRGASLKDVGIDSIGVTTALLLCVICTLLYRLFVHLRKLHLR